MSIQIPLSIHREYANGPLELHIARITWNTYVSGGPVGDGQSYSSKLSFKLQFVPEQWVIGVSWVRADRCVTVFVCPLPCLSFRIRLRRSYGGLFP